MLSPNLPPTLPCFISKLRTGGYKLSEFYATFACIGGTQSIYKNEIHQTFNRDFEAYL